MIKRSSKLVLSAALLSLLPMAAPAAAETGDDPPEHHRHGPHGHAGDAGEHAHGGHGEGGYHHDFSDVEHWSARFDAPERDEWQQPSQVVELLEISPGMTVADLGAGTGYFMPYLAEAVGEAGRVLALDVEPSLVEHLADRAAKGGFENVEARKIPYDDAGLEPATTDRILVVNTWHHIDARPAYSAGLAQALAEGGRIYVVDFTRDSPEGPPKQHRLTAEQVIRELEEGGLRAQVVEASLPRQYVVMAHR